jgi:peptidoglycan/LPS O-acetylase OafA/YrhL
MITTSLAYGLLLGAEGFALLAWGTLSRVRRRAMLGLAAITAAVLMAVMIPLIQGASQNLTGGWWLVIGGVAGVVFIAAGSLIEKYRTRVGDRLTEWGEIIERWE